jgi:protein TonB
VVKPTAPRPTTVTPVVPTFTPTAPTFTPTPLPPPGTADGIGTGGGNAPPVKLTPVVIGPELDSRYAASFQPNYPTDERRAGHTGRVVVRVLVGVDGRVKQVEKVSAPSDSFFEATERRALDKWRFKPGTRDGVPIESWRTMGVSFVLQDE